MKMHFFINFMFFMDLFSFVMSRKHMLMMLLSSEFIILSSLFLMFMYFLNSIISLLVSSIRSHGSDYFNLLNLLW